MRCRRTLSGTASLLPAVLALQILVCGIAAAESRPAPALKHLKKVRVGLYENKPKIYTGEAGVPSGIFPAILEEIARKEQWQLTYVPCEWFVCLEHLRQGRLDLMPDVAISPQRAEEFDFHKEEVVASWSAVYASDRKRLGTMGDLDGRRVAVLKGSIQQTILEQMARGFGFTVTFVEADSFEDAFQRAAKGDADAVVSNHFFGDFFHQRYRLDKTAIVFNPVSLYFSTTSGANADLLEAIDDNLRELKADPGSVYYQALARWMEKPAVVLVPPYLRWLLGGVSGLLVLALAFIALLRWQVRVGTRHLASANEQLRESEAMFRDLFQQHTAVKLLINPDTGAIVEANPAAERFYGWSRDQLRRMRIQDINILSPEQVDAEMEKARHQHRVHLEFRHRLADGSIRDVVVFSSRIDIKGRPLLHSIVHDISDRRRLEEQLRQAHKMEAVGRLAGGVAHDYNNMLSVILGRTELAMSGMDPANPLHAHLKEIMDAATRSADITRQLLAFARKQPVAPQVLDLNEAVGEMLKMLRWLIGENIELAWLPAAGVWPVKIDPAQLDQVLANLCVNARDAIAAMGRITIETANVAFDESRCADPAGPLPGEFVLLTVSDSGRGIDKDVLDHVFEPFFTTKGVGEGTGLGLATVYGIVKQNNGFINVYSEPGKGTTFKLYFPRHAGRTETPAAEDAAAIPPGSGETLLLVEDDRAIREVCREMLQSLDYRVIEAGTPGEALRLAGEHAGGIDLLITDVVMPEMNGRELAERLHASQPALRVLFMSGYTEHIIARQGMLEVEGDFIQKPFTKRDLARKVRAGLGRRPAIPAAGDPGVAEDATRA